MVLPIDDGSDARIPSSTTDNSGLPTGPSPLDVLDLSVLDLEAATHVAVPWYFRFPGYKERFYHAHCMSMRATQHKIGRQLTDTELRANSHVLAASVHDANQIQAASLAVNSMSLYFLYKRQRAGLPTAVFKLRAQSAMLSRLTLGAALFYFAFRPIALATGLVFGAFSFNRRMSASSELQEVRALLSTQQPTSTTRASDIQRPPGLSSSDFQHPFKGKESQVNRANWENYNDLAGTASESNSRLDEVDLSHIDFEQLAQASWYFDVDNDADTYERHLREIITREQHTINRRMTTEEISDFTLADARAKRAARGFEQAAGSGVAISGAIYVLRKPIPVTPTRVLRLTGAPARFSRFCWRTLPFLILANLSSYLVHDGYRGKYRKQYCTEYPTLHSFVQERSAAMERQGLQPLRGHRGQEMAGQNLKRDRNLSPAQQFPSPQDQERPYQNDDDASPAASTNDSWETTNINRDSPIQSTQQTQQTPLRQRGREQEQRYTAPSDDFWDDASPTSQQPSNPLDHRSSPTRGAWDRLRRQAAEKKGQEQMGEHWDQREREASNTPEDSGTKNW